MKFTMRLTSKEFSEQFLEFDDHDGMLTTQYALTKIIHPKVAEGRATKPLPQREELGFVNKDDVKRLARAS